MSTQSSSPSATAATAVTGMARISFWLLVAISALWAVGHLGLALANQDDDPILFVGLAGLNALSVVVLVAGYRAGSMWAWWAIWIEIAVTASVVFIGDASDPRLQYGVIAAVMAALQVGALRGLPQVTARTV